MTAPLATRRPLPRRRAAVGRRGPDIIAWVVVVLAFAFGFGLLLQPSRSFVLSPMEHAQRQTDARDRTVTVNEASDGLAAAWPSVTLTDTETVAEGD